MIKFSSPESLFTQRVLSSLSSLRRPVGQVHNLLQNTLVNPRGNGFMTENNVPLMATFLDPKTRTNIGVQSNFTPMDIAIRLRQARNQFRKISPLQTNIKQRMLN